MEKPQYKKIEKLIDKPQNSLKIIITFRLKDTMNSCHKYQLMADDVAHQQ